MYMEYLFYLKALPEEERITQILIIVAILTVLLLIGIISEIIKKKYRELSKFFNKLNIFNRKETKKDV